MAMPYKMFDNMIRCQICSAANGTHPDVYHTPPECKPTPVATEPCPACGNRNRCPSCKRHDGNPHDPNCPTLTCSEVVERLATECFVDGHGCFTSGGTTECYSDFDREIATAVLHSWRERWVQELPILEKFEDEIALHGGFGLTIDQLENLRAALVTAIGKASYPSNSEQIRKGEP